MYFQMAISPFLGMRIEFYMGDFERIFYALSFYYIHFLNYFSIFLIVSEMWGSIEANLSPARS